MIDLYKISLYVITIISLVGTPGPVVLLVINVSLKHGFLQGLKTIIGTNTASLVLMSIASMAVMGLISIYGKLLNWISLIGAFYLLFLAIRYFVDGYKMDQSQDTPLNIKACGGFKQGLFSL
jgi:threonine/homoserine/homoserine lactone efflux protein